ncbi:hypothetical protein ACWFRJ_34095 [Streptomyces sp. NPDC055239]
MEERRAARIIHKELGLPAGAGLMDLVDAVGEKRGRPIEIVPLPLSPQATGMCLPGEQGDRLIITTNTSPHHARFILGHELFHLYEGGDDCVSGHHFLGPDALESEVSSLPQGLVDEVMSRPAFFRTTFERKVEWRAEAFGTVAALQLTGRGDDAGSLTSAFANRRFR